MIESPSDGVPVKAPRWDLTRTEACSGEEVFLVCTLIYGEYLGIYRRKITVRGATGAHKLGAPPRGASPELVAALWPF